MISAADFDLLTGCGSDVRRPSSDRVTGRRTGGEMVGARGFEPPTSRSRTVRATRLRYAPTRRAHCTESSDLPGVLSHELHELALAAEARLHFAADLLHHGQRLVHGVTDRHHHTPALEELRHEPHDVRLGDRLLFADRQWVVAVRAVLQRLLHEEMAWHPAHRGQHTLVGDTAARELLLDHARAGRLVRVAGPLHYPLRGFLFGTAVDARRGDRSALVRNCAFRPAGQSLSWTSAR